MKSTMKGQAADETEYAVIGLAADEIEDSYVLLKNLLLK